MAYVCKHANIVDGDNRCPACDEERRQYYAQGRKCVYCHANELLVFDDEGREIFPCDNPEGHRFEPLGALS